MSEVVIQSGTPERIAFELMTQIRAFEVGQGVKFDRASVLALYSECLRAVKGLNEGVEVSFVEPKETDEIR